MEIINFFSIVLVNFAVYRILMNSDFKRSKAIDKINPLTNFLEHSYFLAIFTSFLLSILEIVVYKVITLKQ